MTKTFVHVTSNIVWRTKLLVRKGTLFLYTIQTKLALPEKDTTIAEIDDNLDQQV